MPDVFDVLGEVEEAVGEGVVDGAASDAVVGGGVVLDALTEPGCELTSARNATSECGSQPPSDNPTRIATITATRRSFNTDLLPGRTAPHRS